MHINLINYAHELFTLLECLSKNGILILQAGISNVSWNSKQLPLNSKVINGEHKILLSITIHTQ